MKAKLITMFNESTIIQGGVTFLLIGTLCYGYITTGSIDETLLSITGVVVGYWFGSKTSMQYAQGVKNGEKSFRNNSNSEPK